FGVVGPLQVGCTPISRATSPIGACNARANSIAAAIPSRLAVAMYMLRNTDPDIIYSIANIYNIVTDITNSPTIFGIRNVTAPSCGYGTLSSPPPQILLYVGTAKGTYIGIRLDYPKTARDWPLKQFLTKIQNTRIL
ncbi:hypothetical protein LINGRAHAP2_LOCUS2826, partial [Linum grandiflorum]